MTDVSEVLTASLVRLTALAFVVPFLATREFAFVALKNKHFITRS
jgi:hypothetical protein